MFAYMEYLSKFVTIFGDEVRVHIIIIFKMVFNLFLKLEIRFFTLLCIAKQIFNNFLNKIEKKDWNIWYHSKISHGSL